MVNEHFSHVNDGHRIESPFIWECTRFCLAPGADSRVSAALALGAGELMAEMKLAHYVGVFDSRMERIYRLMGLEPAVLGRRGEGRDRVGVGLWSMDEAAFAPTLAKVGVDRATSRAWLRSSLLLGLRPSQDVLDQTA
jgi:acyl homoserine lactone synthase